MLASSRMWPTNGGSQRRAGLIGVSKSKQRPTVNVDALERCTASDSVQTHQREVMTSKISLGKDLRPCLTSEIVCELARARMLRCADTHDTQTARGRLSRLGASPRPAHFQPGGSLEALGIPSTTRRGAPPPAPPCLSASPAAHAKPPADGAPAIDVPAAPPPPPLARAAHRLGLSRGCGGRRTRAVGVEVLERVAEVLLPLALRERLGHLLRVEPALLPPVRTARVTRRRGGVCGGQRACK